MFDKIKYTVKHTAIYGLGSLSTKVLGFILLPIYFHYLTVEQYGILAIFEVTAQILSEVLLISIPTSIIRWYASEKDIDTKKSIVFTSFLFISLISISISLIFIPFNNEISMFFFDTYLYAVEFIYLFLWVSLSLLDRVVLSLIRVKQKSVFFVFLSTMKLAIILSLNIYFVVYSGLGIKGILLSQVIGHVALLTISSFFVIKNSNLSFNFRIMKEMLKFGLPLIVSTLSSQALTLGDRYIIKIFLGNAAVGIYNAGYKIASFINMLIIQPFQLGFLPIAFAQVDKPNSNRFYSKVLTYLTLVLSLAFVFISLFGGLIVMLLTNKSEYLSSVSLIPFISLAFVFRGIQYVLGLGFHYVKKTKYNAYLVLFASSINVILNILLIPVYGLKAAVVVMNLSMIPLIFMTYHFVQKKYFINYENIKIIKTILIAIAIVTVSMLLDYLFLSLRTSTLIRTALFLIFPIILYYLNFFEEVEILRLKQSWGKWKNPSNWQNMIKKK